MRSILIKIVFFNRLFPVHLLMAARRGWPQLNAKSNVRATMPTKRPAADVQPLESKGRMKKGPSKSTEVGAKPPPVPIPVVISGVDPLSLSSREESRAVISASSSRRQGAEARRVKRTRCGKKKSRTLRQAATESKL